MHHDRSDYEFVGNYKLLQVAFDKNNVNKYVDVNKLIRAKYQGEKKFDVLVVCELNAMIRVRAPHSSNLLTQHNLQK